LGGQVDEVAQFVADNARRVLGVDAAKVLPVSARAALQAKLDATHSRNGFFGESQIPSIDVWKIIEHALLDSIIRFTFKIAHTSTAHFSEGTWKRVSSTGDLRPGFTYSLASELTNLTSSS